MKNILGYGLLILVVYWIATAVFHFPIYGAFFLFPLAICALMFLFMDHGNHARKEKKTHHG